MIRPPPKDAPVSCLEQADAATYMAWMRSPSDATERAWMAAWCKLTNEIGMTTPTRCSDCGLHRSGLTRDEPCRLCTELKDTATE